jgi:hypothetical protein
MVAADDLALTVVTVIKMVDGQESRCDCEVSSNSGLAGPRFPRRMPRFGLVGVQSFCRSFPVEAP